MGLKSVEGYLLDKEYNISFTTEVLKMYLVSSHPENLEINIDYSDFYATFGYNIDEPTVAANVELLQGVDVVPSTISIDLVDPKQINIVPNDVLLYNTEYTLHFKTGLTGEGRELNAEHNILFTTVPVMYLVTSHPEDAEVDVNYSDFYVVFDYNIDIPTIADNVELLLIDAVVPSTIAIDTNLKRINITPDDELTYGGVYTIHIKTGLTGEGYYIDQEYNISFTVETPVMLLLTSSPYEDELNVKYRSFYATFDCDIDILTIADNVELLLVDVVVPSTISIDANPKRINIIPDDDLPASTEYTLHFKTGLMGEGRHLDQEYSISFTTGEVYQLHITGSHPVDDEIDVGYRNFYVDFDFDVDSGTVADNVELLLDSIPVSCNISSELARINIVPVGDLIEGDEYVLHFKTGLTGEGYLIDQEYNISFTTGTAAIMTLDLVNSYPDSYDIIDVPIADNFYLTFDHNIDEPTVAANVELLLDGEVVPSDIYIYGGDYLNEIDIEPTDDLIYGGVYTIRLKTGLTGEGCSLDQEYNISFTTVQPLRLLSTTVEDDDTEVPLDTVITATFNMPVDISNLGSSGYGIKLQLRGAPSMSGCGFEAVDNTVVITPYALLIGNAIYDLTFYPYSGVNTHGVESDAGQPLDQEYTIHFHTKTVLALTESVPILGDYSQVIPTTQVITLTFNMDVDPATVIYGNGGGGTVCLIRYYLEHNYWNPTDLVCDVEVVDNVVTLTPTVALNPNNYYQVWVGEIKSLDGDITQLYYTDGRFRVSSILNVSFVSSDPVTETVIDFSLQGTDSIAVTFGANILSSSTYPWAIVWNNGTTDYDASSIAMVDVVNATITITPFTGTSLVGGTEHTLTFKAPYAASPGITDESGNALATDVVIKVTTEPSSNYLFITEISPSHGTQGVARTVHPVVTFDANVDSGTVTYGPSGSINLRRGSTNIAGSVSVVNDTIIITPTSQLNANYTHTIDVRTTIQSVGAQPLLWESNTTFETGAT